MSGPPGARVRLEGEEGPWGSSCGCGLLRTLPLAISWEAGMEGGVEKPPAGSGQRQEGQLTHLFPHSSERPGGPGEEGLGVCVFGGLSPARGTRVQF